MPSRRPAAALLAALTALTAGATLGACGGGAGGAATTVTMVTTVTVGEPRAPAGAERVAALFDDVPQAGLMLGRLDAPVTLVEYLDMESRASVAYARDVFPALVRRFVRPGRLRVELRLQPGRGDDAVKVARSVVAASFQDHGWDFAQLVFANEGLPHAGDDLEDFLRAIADAMPELDGVRLGRDAASPDSMLPIKQGETDLGIFGFRSVPAFRLGPTGGGLRPIGLGALRRAIAGGALPYVG
ncbi:MAG TPA: hypothetical protein VHB30_01955 [Solirubrobacteraceae bacterium]|nr:hypothetical protein [Solirubrobacteraceae bacterium]